MDKPNEFKNFIDSKTIWFPLGVSQLKMAKLLRDGLSESFK